MVIWQLTLRHVRKSSSSIKHVTTAIAEENQINNLDQSPVVKLVIGCGMFSKLNLTVIISTHLRSFLARKINIGAYGLTI